ncbi:MAG: GAF domain-containing protein, partial [Gemmatimonadetes bacterium]|nr:GAF domain-containing protein [Gemmatimonadota bacterium]
MTTATRIPVDQAGLSQLHAAMEPRATYDALAEILTDRFGSPPRGAYVATATDHFALDPQCVDTSELPSEVTGDGFVDGALVVPYHYRGRVLGLIVLDGELSPHREEISDLLDDHFAPSLFRASYLSQTLADQRRANEQLYYLTEMSKLLGELDVEMLLVNILELTSSYLGADVGSITLREGDAFRTGVDWGLPLEALTAIQLNDGTPVLEHALTHRQPLFLTDQDITPGQGGYHVERLLVLPLGTSNEVLGTINLVASADGIQFGPERLEIVRPGVGLAAMALENAMLVEIKLEREREQEQLALGQQIQQGLLPQEAPRYEGLDVAGHSVAAKMIGGDYFDYFTLPDGCPGLVVADVAGKGVPAGLIMTAARAMFRG